MIKALVSIGVFIMLFSCNSSIEIDQLKTKEEHRIFLEEIFNLDQGIRESNDFNNDVDVSNLNKIAKYLDQYGYPNINEVGKTAALTPWLVIHHSIGSKELKIRKKYFKTIYNAYKDGNIDIGKLELYLTRCHILKFGVPHRMDKIYSGEEKINDQIEKLGFGSLLDNK